MWRAWKNAPAVKENPDLVDEVRKQVERSASRTPDVQFPDFDGEEFVNESEESMDSNQRVAVIITDGYDVLVGKSPQNRFKEFACCDLMKGHVQVGEGLEEAAIREVQEECGLRLANLKKISSELKYSKGTTLTFFVSRMEKLPDPSSLECQSFYEYNGKQYPEIAQYLAVPIDELPTYLYKGLDELTKDINNNSYNKYALQLNVYEWAAKDGGKIPRDATVSKELHHFQYLEDGKPVKIRVVKVPDLQPLVQAMVDRAVELGVVKRK